MVQTIPNEAVRATYNNIIKHTMLIQSLKLYILYMNCNCNSYGHNIVHIELLLSTIQKHYRYKLSLISGGLVLF